MYSIFQKFVAIVRYELLEKTISRRSFLVLPSFLVLRSFSEGGSEVGFSGLAMDHLRFTVIIL